MSLFAFSFGTYSGTTERLYTASQSTPSKKGCACDTHTHTHTRTHARTHAHTPLVRSRCNDAKHARRRKLKRRRRDEEAGDEDKEGEMMLSW
jgi:hypothetical protein